MGGTLRRFSCRCARLRHNEGGFTLTELVISIAILGIVSGVLAAAFVVSGKTSAQTSERYNESHDAQIASAYLATDVQGAQATTAESCFAGGLTSLVNFSATQPPASPPYPITSWLYGTATEGRSGQVVRRSCTGPNPADLTSDAPVIYHVSGTTPPVMSCDVAACNVVTITIHDHNRVDNTDDFVYSLTGARRAQLSETGTALPVHASLMALGTTEPSSVVGDVHVNGAPIMNSKTTHLVPDPFAGLPQCPAAAGCPSANGPGVDVPEGAKPDGPGVYHNVTINSAVTFPPGIYVITGLLDVQSKADGLDLAGVTLYFACTNYPAPCDGAPKSKGGSFSFGQAGAVTLSPVTSGEYAKTPQFPGISIFVDRTMATANLPIPGFTSGMFDVSGAVYAANSRIVFTGGGGQFTGGIVSKYFDIAPTGTIAIGG